MIVSSSPGLDDSIVDDSIPHSLGRIDGVLCSCSSPARSAARTERVSGANRTRRSRQRTRCFALRLVPPGTSPVWQKESPDHGV